jgi:SAM-dependent methyltransferase
VTNVNYTAELLQRDKIERKHIIELLKRIKDEYSISGNKITELGCGLGQNLEVFKDDNYIIGVEGVQDAVDLAQHLDINVILGDLNEPLMLESNSFDWVMCLDVLEHLMNPFELMKEIHRILKNEGKAILNVPNHFTLSGRVKMLFGNGMDVHNYFPNHKEWENPHIRFFTRSGFFEMIASAHFEIIDDYSYLVPSIPKSAMLINTGFSRNIYWVTKRFPALFAAGNFVVLEKL